MDQNFENERIKAMRKEGYDTSKAQSRAGELKASRQAEIDARRAQIRANAGLS